MQEISFSFINYSGLSPQIIYFLLVAPIIVAVGTFGRHLIGLKLMSINVLLSLVYVLAFIVPDNTMASIILGLVLSVFIYFCSYYVKKLSINAGMHYFARISFVIAVIALISLGVLAVSVYFLNLQSHMDFAKVNPFAVVLLVALSEFFSSNQIQKGIKISRMLFINTLALGVGTAFLVSLYSFQRFLLDYPVIILFVIISLFFIGKYSGMRLNEVLRFSSISTNNNSSETKND